MLNTPAVEIEAPGLAVTTHSVDTGTARYDLTVTVVDQGGSLTGWIEYSTDLFDRATIDRMVDHWRTLLEAVIADPDAPSGATCRS